MSEPKLVGYCDIVVKNKKIKLDSNLPIEILYSIARKMVDIYDLNNEKGLELLQKTKVNNAKYHFTLDEDSVITFEPALLNKTDIKRFISVVTSLLKDNKKDEENKNESSYS